MHKFLTRTLFQFAPDYGTPGASYKPSVIFSGQIGKIAQQVIEGMDIRSKFDVFDKSDIEYGEGLEVTLYEEATGLEYNANGNYTSFPNPVGHTLLFNKTDDFVFFTKINKFDINKASFDAASAEKNAEVIVETLYDGDRLRKNTKVYELLNTAVAGTPSNAGTTQIVNGGQFAEVTDKATAEAFVLSVKLLAGAMRNEPEIVNPYGLKKTASRRIVLVLPYQLRVKVNTYLKAQSSDAEYLQYDVDEIVEVPATATGNAVYLVDDRYVMIKKRKFGYEEKNIFGTGGNVQAALVTSRGYWICPLFPAAKLTQGQSGLKIALTTEKAIAVNTSAAAKINTKRNEELAQVAKNNTNKE